VSCRVTVQENPCCTVRYIVSLMYFFWALNEALICREIGFEATDEIVMVSMICLAAEQVVSWWIMLNRRRLDPTTVSHASKPVNIGSCSVNICKPALERRIIPTQLLRSQASFLLINCDHLLKTASCYFPPDLFLITLQNAPKPHTFQLLHFLRCSGWKKARLGSLVRVV